MPDYFFSFGHGHTHPETGKHLLGYYVRITARDSAEARGEMITRFGIKWSMQYDKQPEARFFERGEFAHYQSAAVRELLAFMEVNKAGFAGILKGGTLVDRREHPAAIPVPANSMMGIPAPKCVPCGGSGAVPTMPDGEPEPCGPCNGTGLWLDPDPE